MKRFLLLSLVSFAFLVSSGQALQLQHPTKGDVWPAFTQQRIQWQFANVDNIKIEISTDSSRTWTLLASSYPASAGFYDWTVINKPSDSCFVRITDIGDANVQSSNYPNSPFRIPKPTLSLENIEASVFGKTALPISWTSTGTQKVRLLVSYDNLASSQLIADNIPAGNGFFNWIVTDVITAKCFLVIQSVDNASVTDTSQQTFSINQLPGGTVAKFRGGSYDGHAGASNKLKGVRLLNPNNREQLSSNTIYNIRWISSEINQVDLKLSIDSGNTWTNIATGFSGGLSTYNWTVPSTPSTKCLVKIVDASDSSLYDISDSAFTINANTLNLATSGVNEIAYRAGVLPITWTSLGTAKINIAYLDGTAWKTIKDAVNANNEVFNWVIPSDISDSTQIKISDYDNSLLTDTSAVIRIKTSPSISPAKYRGGSYDGHSSATNKSASLKLTNPSGNIQMASAIPYNITWSGAGISTVDLALSIDSGGSWQSIVTAYSNTGNYLWTVPGTASTKCLIRVRSSEDSTLNDTSDSVFTILNKSLDLLLDTAVVRYFETALPIEWSQRGIEKVSLSYRTSANGSWQKIKDGTPSTNELYNWIVPAFSTDSLWVRIFDAKDLAVQDEQLFAGVFKALPPSTSAKYKGGSFDGHSFRSTNYKISIYKPAANDTLKSGSTYPISWISGNVMDSVTLQYSLDSGLTWKNIVTTPAINGHYEWIVPSVTSQRNSNVASYRSSSDLLSDRCLVRAISGNSPDEIIGISRNTFSIEQALVISANYYWVGGTGLWSDYSHHWATTSGGTTFHSRPPSSANNVVFDANSFSSAEQTVTVNAPAECKNMDWKDISNKPNLIITSTNTLTVHGSITSALH